MVVQYESIEDLHAAMKIATKVFEDHGKLTKILEAEDDRGLVLSLSAFAESALERMLLTFLMDVPESKDLVCDFNAPLGTFSAKIKAAYAFGLLTASQKRDLDLLRKIRNSFAHSWEALDFEKVAGDRVREMSDSRIDDVVEGEPSREKLRKIGLCILSEILFFTLEMRDRDENAQPFGRHLARIREEDDEVEIGWENEEDRA